MKPYYIAYRGCGGGYSLCKNKEIAEDPFAPCGHKHKTLSAAMNCGEKKWNDAMDGWMSTWAITGGKIRRYSDVGVTIFKAWGEEAGPDSD